MLLLPTSLIISHLKQPYATKKRGHHFHRPSPSKLGFDLHIPVEHSQLAVGCSIFCVEHFVKQTNRKQRQLYVSLIFLSKSCLSSASLFTLSIFPLDFANSEQLHCREGICRVISAMSPVNFPLPTHFGGTGLDEPVAPRWGAGNLAGNCSVWGCWGATRAIFEKNTEKRQLSQTHGITYLVRLFLREFTPLVWEYTSLLRVRFRVRTNYVPNTYSIRIWYVL